MHQHSFWYWIGGGNLDALWQKVERIAYRNETMDSILQCHFSAKVMNGMAKSDGR